MRVVGIVLAAGESRRMGAPKQALPFGGTTVLGAVVGALVAAGLDEVLVVLGHHAEAARACVDGLPVRVVVNPAPERGMLSSAQCGLLAAGEADAYLVAPGDQPRITAEVVRALVSEIEAARDSIIVPVFAGRRGHPVVFGACWREAILALPLTVGLNSVLRERPEAVREVAVESAAVLEDIDTPEDYRRAVEAAGHADRGAEA